jgi:hypothetical protein
MAASEPTMIVEELPPHMAPAGRMLVGPNMAAAGRMLVGPNMAAAGRTLAPRSRPGCDGHVRDGAR